jgi:hypothetical protein
MVLMDCSRLLGSFVLFFLGDIFNPRIAKTQYPPAVLLAEWFESP